MDNHRAGSELSLIQHDVLRFSLCPSSAFMLGMNFFQKISSAALLQSHGAHELLSDEAWILIYVRKWHAQFVDTIYQMKDHLWKNSNISIVQGNHNKLFHHSTKTLRNSTSKDDILAINLRSRCCWFIKCWSYSLKRNTLSAFMYVTHNYKPMQANSI